MEYKDTNPRRQTKKSRKKAKKRSRVRKGFVAFLLIFIVVATLITLSLTVFFKTEQLIVSGNLIHESNEILKECGIKTGDNMFLVSGATVEKNLKKEFPFIESVKLKRTLPDKIEIVITEATEYYCYPYAGQFFTANKENRVLASYSSAPVGLVLMKVNGLKNVEIGKNIELTDETEKNYLTRLMTALDKYDIKVTSIDMTDMLAIKAVVEERIVVNFGGPTDFDGKTAYLGTFLKGIDKDVKGSMNLSVWSTSKTEGYFIKDNLQ